MKAQFFAIVLLSLLFPSLVAANPKITTLETSANAGNVNAQLDLAKAYYYGRDIQQDYPTAIKWLKQALRSDNPQAKTLMGLALTSGHGVKKNLEQAFQLFAEASRSKDGEAQYYLGRAYLKGKGTDANIISAYIWLTLSSHQSHTKQLEAKQTQQEVAKLMTPAQLNNANILVEQFKSMYEQ
ncbi:tetratricopeptide repeat protein [Spartinivicinus poritis]|uniref:Tetratricopeptide repeat protein n=1 Tax=Spartinivicinus poritis TaxID=2994640 RepID=A0ABT5U6J5_9GAMM|nr:tetratricopeptide repeat protein [Spartinivicinus sp. A2-2]MDE1461977.1 tetratricopeptide repeat protein [Spartinivicinus sp. A2-2]